MARARYPLKVVKNQRTRQRDRAYERLAHYIRELERAEQKQQQLRDAQPKLEVTLREAMAVLYKPDVQGQIEIQIIENRNNHLQFLQKKLEEHEQILSEQEHRVASARQAVREARQGLARALRELKAVEKHYQKWLLAHKRMQQRRAQKKFDEITASAFVRKQWEDPE